MDEYGIARNELITDARARGTAYDVRNADGVKVGVVAHGDLGWRVFSAGWGVKVDHNETHRFRDAAIDALVAAREVASQPGGALAVDRSGLTGHQRACIDLMAHYAMVSTAKRNAVIWDQFDMNATQFFTEWNALIDNPHALAYNPTVINRHLRLRDQRKARRGVPAASPVPA